MLRHEPLPLPQEDPTFQLRPRDPLEDHGWRTTTTVIALILLIDPVPPDEEEESMVAIVPLEDQR